MKRCRSSWITGTFSNSVGRQVESRSHYFRHPFLEESSGTLSLEWNATDKDRRNLIRASDTADWIWAIEEL